VKKIISEAKKTGVFFLLVYLGIIAYVFLSIYSTNSLDNLNITIFIVILITIVLDLINRWIKKNSHRLFRTIKFLRKTREFYDKNPWRKGFIFPGIFFLSTFFFLEISAEAEGFFGKFLGTYFLLAWAGSPLWVLVGWLTTSKKTPYNVSLLTGFIVVPTFVAWYAVNGFTNGAKKNAIKTMHAQTVKYISAEIQKCQTGESKFMSNNKDCPATAAKSVSGAVATMTDKNPFDTLKNAVRVSENNTNNEDVGYVSLSHTGSTIFIKTCIDTPCKKEKNRLQNTILIN